MKEYITLEGPKVYRAIDALSQEVKAAVIEYNPDFNNLELSRLHHYFSDTTIKDVRISIFRYLNKLPGSHDLILKNIGGESLTSILGPDLLIQTKLNLSIQMPNDENSTLDLHSDCWSGDTAFQVNLWIPLTRSYSTNSMFILSKEKTLNCIDKIRTNPILDRSKLLSLVSDEDFLDVDKGKAIIFNPALIHGNVVNRTEETRVSINVRFKALFSPDATNENVSRSAGIYYRFFCLSEWTKLAIDLDLAHSEP
jgi:sporadic carbohydrate cluster 2OG-Fe(II) oxygenase